MASTSDRYLELCNESFLRKIENEKWSSKKSDGDERDQELKWRTGAATFWLLAMVILPVSGFLLISNFKLFSPFPWIKDFISKLLSGWFLAYVLMIQSLCLPLLIMHYKCTKVQMEPLKTTWKQLLHILHPRQLVWIVLTSAVTLLFAILYTIMIYESITIDICHHDSSCVGLTRNSLLFFGLLTGLRYQVCYFKDKHYVLEFPIIQEKRFFRTRASLSDCFKNALTNAIQTLKIFYLLHIIFGLGIGVLFNVFSGAESISSLISNTWSIMNFSFVWVAVSMGTSTLFILNLADCIYKIFITQRYSFVLKSDFVGDHRLLLQEALLSENTILKYLAFLDLCQIGKFDEKRRKDVFAITLPGGHPENWNLILSQCVFAIDQSAKKFDEANLLELKANQTNTKTSRMGNKSGATPSKGFASPMPNPVTSPSSLFSPVKDWKSTEDVADGTKIRSPTLKDQKHGHSLKKTSPKIPLFASLLEERPDYKREYLFQDQQLIIWSLEGLSSLVAASFDEDTYGIVQRTLPQILVILLSYLEKIERFLKIAVADDKLQINKLKDFHKKKVTTSIAQSYKLAVQTAIYRITTKFGCNLEARCEERGEEPVQVLRSSEDSPVYSISVRIPREHRKRLDSFIEFRE